VISDSLVSNGRLLRYHHSGFQPSCHNIYSQILCHALSSSVYASPNLTVSPLRTAWVPTQVSIAAHLMAIEIICQILDFTKAGKSAVCWWVPGQTGLPRNEAARETASHGNLVSEWAVSGDVRAYLHHTILSSWQDEWTATRNNRLQIVKRYM
jgi:hypothetical protein